MSSPTPNNDTAQQRRERLLLAQAERQRARELEIARQEAEFAAEMDRLEEEAAREAEEKRVAEEKRQAEERRMEEERRVFEEQRKKQEAIAEKKKVEEMRLAEVKRREEARLANEAAAEAEEKQVREQAYLKLVEENKKEKEKAARELAKRTKPIPAAKQRQVDVVPPPRSSGSKKTSFKSKSVISDDSDDAGVEKEREATPRGVKRKRTTKMIVMVNKTPAVDDDFDPEDGNDNEDEDPASPLDPSTTRPACSRCVLIGKSDECRPQSTRQRTQACELCHLQRQRCSWSGDNASRRARGKRAKIEEEEVYEGPASRVAARSLGGSEVVDRFDRVEQCLGALERYASRSATALERIATILERIGENQLGRKEEAEPEEDEDGEGEEDEEEAENEEERRVKIREGKRRAE
ncbi:hypothetical protein F5890DRAFT_1560313 [Lentinula detonsa]|uniref:Uncharacterized protein n=1 Tax=Lentinula detonsa TaxID=2804962 RepID=A0AA38PN07_9AGAR|nr:hypothetical protein F5890DRAFT_1560313 [Lentinula detonsa]